MRAGKEQDSGHKKVYIWQDASPMKSAHDGLVRSAISTEGQNVSKSMRRRWRDSQDQDGQPERLQAMSG